MGGLTQQTVQQHGERDPAWALLGGLSTPPVPGVQGLPAARYQNAVAESCHIARPRWPCGAVQAEKG